MEISIDVLIADSRLAFVQGRYNESLKLADEAKLMKIILMLINVQVMRICLNRIMITQ